MSRFRSIANSCHRHKYELFCLLCLYIVMWILLSPSSVPKTRPVNLKYVTVHLDLKGSPPKMSYLESILPILHMYGVNAILMEYEDMFPYWGNIVNISSKNSYSKEELIRFMTNAKQLNVEIIPLIQTFGHMEFVLKLKEYAHLREDNEFNANICPSNPTSLLLISTMLQQVIDLHSIVKPLKHIHVGCDEVRKINMCPKCKERKLETTALFLKHVEKLSSIVKKISPGTKVLIWGDMFAENKILPTNTSQRNALHNVEVVSWNYNAYPKFIHTYYYNLHKMFKQIWIASAFKGADGESAMIPNIRKRFKNHLAWMKFILNYKFGGETEVYNFRGIILTGWSRYSHEQPQCELLPVAMPSLMLNLLLIKKLREGSFDYADLTKMNDCQFFNKHLSAEFQELYRSYNHSKECSFENTYRYVELQELSDRRLLKKCRSHLYQDSLKCTGPHALNLDALENNFDTCDTALEKLQLLKNYLKSFMVEYYDNHVITSYINQTVQVPSQKVVAMVDNIKQCMYTEKKI